MRVRMLGLLFMILFVGGCKDEKTMLPNEENETVVKEILPAETFIQRNLLKEDGRMGTNLTDRQDEYLSETVGLWMDYLIEKNDFAQFDEQVKVMETYFLTKNHLVIWELKGTKKAPANAFIDDLRIVNALYRAGEQWNHRDYINLADKMSESLARYQTREYLMVDYINLENKDQGSDVTLSYIIPEGFDRMKEYGHLPVETYEATQTLLVEAPYTATSLFPKTYHIDTGEYSYDEEVNMIDQFYVGYHRAQWDADINKLLQFTKEAYSEGNGKLFGRYNPTTKEPVVSYESVAVYALAILMCLEVEENDFAKELYSQMKTLQYTNEESLYDGGYMDIDSKDTHTFDNLLALIAERKGIDEAVF